LGAGAILLGPDADALLARAGVMRERWWTTAFGLSGAEEHRA